MLKKMGIALLIVIVALFIFKDVLVKGIVCSVGSDIIGAPLKIGSLGWNPFAQKMHIANLRLMNPSGFPNQALVDIPSIDMDYDAGAMIKGQMHFPYIDVDLKETTIVKNEQGKLNVDALKIAHPTGPKQDLNLSIDEMKLNVEHTVYSDYSSGQPVNKEFDLGLKNKTFKNIKSVNQLVSVILVQGMGPVAIKSAALYGARAFVNSLSTGGSGIASGLLDAISQKLK